MFNNVFPKYRAVYEIMWKNMVDPERPHMALFYTAHTLYMLGC